MSDWIGKLSSISVGAFIVALSLAGQAYAGPLKGPATVDCGDGSNSAELQEEINEADNGRAIEVSGTCKGNYVISSDDVVLQGQPGAEIVGMDQNQPAITIVGDRVVIEGFDDGSSISSAGIGIRIEHGGSATIRDNMITGTRSTGVSVFDSASALIEGNVIDQSGSSGIVVGRSSSADLRDNIISNSSLNGVLATQFGSLLMSDNTITGSLDDGIKLLQGSLQVEAGNTVNTSTQSDVVCGQLSRIRVNASIDSDDGNFSKFPPGLDCVLSGGNLFN